MRAAVAIDGSEASRYALDLFLKLDFPDPQIYLVHSVESLLPDGSFPELSHEHPLSVEMRRSEEFGRDELEKAQSQAFDWGRKTDVIQVKGAAGESLAHLAKRENIDLLVVGRNRRSAFDDLILGSVAKALLHKLDRHLLIVKRGNVRRGKLTVLLATDQSAEGNRCVETFAKLAPRGVGKVCLLTINEVDPDAAHQLVHGLSVSTEKAEHWISEGLRSEVEGLSGPLKELAYECVSMVEEDDQPLTSITAIADKMDADLIAVGAKPHGFLDRHLRRSISEGLLANDDRALLVLRP